MLSLILIIMFLQLVLNISGLEYNKRPVKMKVEFADGFYRRTPFVKNTSGVGGNTFAGLILIIVIPDCLLSHLKLKKITWRKPANKRDIYSVDDIRYVVSGSGTSYGLSNYTF